MLDTLIEWGPTLLFSVNLVLAILFGLCRGFRKNFILAIQALVAFSACLICFLVLVNDKNVDANMYKNINSLLSQFSGQTLNEICKVSSSCSSIKEVLTEIILNSSTEQGIGNTLNLILADNGAYLAALVNSAYRLVLALLLSIIYVLLIFILYLIYFIFYPERRHKRKVIENYSKAESHKPYKKRRILGALVGSLRGAMSSIVGLSFLGVLLFVVSGSNTETTDIDFGDEAINDYYGIYKSISSYDDYGIYSVLSQIKDSNQVPYYLYIADTVLSGKGTDINSNGDEVEASFVFKNEFGAYTKFSKQTLNLLNKYNPDLIKKVIKGASNDELFSEIYKVFKEEEFQNEFSKLIEEFDGSSFILNFSLSAVDVIAANYDSFMEVDEATKGLLDILFKGEHKIKVSQILTKEDATALLNSVVKLLGTDIVHDSLVSGSVDMANLEAITEASKDLSQTLQGLSLFNAKADSFNLLFEDLFNYVTAHYINNTTENNTTTSKYICNLTNLSTSSVNWASEIKSLFKVIPYASTIYSGLDLSDMSNTELLLDSVFNLLKDDNPNKEANEEALDGIIEIFGNSQIIGVLITLDPVQDALFNSISESFTLILPDISYANEIDSEGNVTCYGETYNLLKAIKALLLNDGEAVVELVTRFKAGDTEGKLSQKLISALDILLMKDDSNKSVADYLADSKLICSILSSYIDTISFDIGDSTVSIYLAEGTYTPIYNSEGDTLRLINSDEIINILSNLKPIVEAYSDLIDNGFENLDINDLLSDDKITTLYSVLQKSSILEGTIAQYLIESLSSFEYVKLPKEYKDASTWLSSKNTDDSYKDGELIKVLKCFKSLSLDINEIMKGNINYIFTDVLTETNVDSLLDIDILYITFSGILQDFSYKDESGNDIFSIIVPTSCLKDTGFTDSSDNKILGLEKAEMKSLLSSILNITKIDDSGSFKINYAGIFEKNTEGQFKLLSSDILYATITYTLISNISLITYPSNSSYHDDAIIILPKSLKDAGTLEALRDNNAYSNSFDSNPWKSTNELSKLLEAIDLLLNISSNPDFDFNSDLSLTLMSNITTLNEKITGSESTKLDVVYESSVMKATLTESLPKLVDAIVIPTDAKSSDGYVNKSELKSLFNIVDKILGDNESIENISFNNLVISADMSSDFINSNIIKSTITKYIVNDDSLKDLISLPSIIIENNHISTSEMQKLYDSLVILLGDTDGSIKISDLSSIDANSLLDINDEELDKLLSSSIINYSITKLLGTAQLSGLTIIVPAETYEATSTVVVDYFGNEIKTISKSTLKSLLQSIDLIIETKNNTQTLNVKNIFVNNDTLLENYILHATIINYIITTFPQDDTDSLITIPSNLVTEGSVSKLSNSLLTNVWYTSKELSYLLGSLDMLLDVSTSSSFSFDDTSALTNKLLKNLKSVNDTYNNGTKLDYIYSSLILKATITQSIPNYACDVIIPLDSLDSDSYIKKEELKTLFTLINNVLKDDEDITDLTASSIVLNEANKNLICSSNILLATITKYLKNSEIEELVIPSIVLDLTNNHIDSDEMSSLLGGIITLFSKENEDLFISNISFSFNVLSSLTKNQIDSLLVSSILKYTISNFMISTNSALELIVPKEVLDDKVLDINGKTVQSIKEESLSSLLFTTLDFMILDDESTTEDETGINLQNVFRNKADIVSNDILHATIINYLVKELDGNSNVIIPQSLKTDSSKDKLANHFTATENSWVSINELSHLFDVLDMLFDISNTPNFDMGNLNITNSLNIMNDVYGTTTKTKLEICYDSLVIKASFASAISGNLDSIPGGAYDLSDYIKLEELKALFDVVGIITPNGAITEITDDTLANINISAIINTISTNENTKIVRALVSNSIIDNLKVSFTSISSELDCYDLSINISLSTNKNTSFSILTMDEIVKLTDGLKTILGISNDLIVSSIDTSNISLSSGIIEDVYSSRVLQRVLSSVLIDTIGKTNILKSCYNNVSSLGIPYLVTEVYYNKYLKEVEIYNLVLGLETVTGQTSIDPNSISFSDVSISNLTIASVLASNIAYVLISNEIKGIDTLPSEVYDTTIISTDSLNVITKDEISSLINSLLIVMNVNSISLNDLSVDNGKISTDTLEDVLDSKIVHFKLTNTITSLVNGVPSKAYTESKKNYLLSSELEALISLVGKETSTNSGIYELSLNEDISFNSFDTSKISIMASSYLVRFKVTANILAASSLAVPNSVIEELDKDKYIVNSTSLKEFENFLNALGTMTTSLTNISVSIPNEQNTNIMSLSVIMRATITNKVAVEGYTVAYAISDIEASYLTADSTLVLTKNAFVDLLAGIRTVSSSSNLTITLNINSILSLNEAARATLLTSNALRYVVSDLITNYLNSITNENLKNQIIGSATKAIEDVYSSSSTSQTTLDSYSKTDLITIINNIKTYV